MLLHNTHFEYDPFYNFVNDFFFFCCMRMNKGCLIDGLKFRLVLCFSFCLILPAFFLCLSLPVCSGVSWRLGSERAINCRGTQGLTLSSSGWRVGLTDAWRRVSTHHCWHWPTDHAGYAVTPALHYPVFHFQQPEYHFSSIQRAFVLK